MTSRYCGDCEECYDVFDSKCPHCVKKIQEKVQVHLQQVETVVEQITVGGITFRADQVVTATVEVDGREIVIGKKEENKKVGFQ